MTSPRRFTTIALVITSGAGAGYCPVAPGTAGSALALPLCFFLYGRAGWVGPLLGCVVLTLLGWWASTLAEEHYGDHDSCHIVVDEMAGQLLTMVCVPCSMVHLIVGFGLFRLFDTVKPWPAGWIDKNMQNALGVMLDDIVAGAYAALTTLALVSSGLVSWVIDRL